MQAIGPIFTGVSLIVGGMGRAAGDNAQAQASERAKEVAYVQADQIDTAYRQDLNTTLSNIRSIRASTGGDPDSPTSQAYMDTERAASDRVRRIKVGAAQMQGNQDGIDATTYRSAAKFSLLGGALQSIPAFMPAFTG